MKRVWLTIILAAAFGLACSLGCKSSEKQVSADAEPWTYHSESAPYSIEIPAQWQREDASQVNSYADFAIRLGERFFVIVIPQELPSIPGIETPDALALKRAGTYYFKKRVDDFEVEREGPIEIGGKTGISMFAEGIQSDDQIQYVIVFVTDDNWGYQVIAWAPRRYEDSLVTALDALLEGWSFESDEYESGGTRAKPAVEQPDESSAGDATPGKEPDSDAGSSSDASSKADSSEDRGGVD